MSVIIPDMEMPESCAACPFMRPNPRHMGWLICKWTGKQTYQMNRERIRELTTKRDDKCPLFEVKAWEEI